MQSLIYILLLIKGITSLTMLGLEQRPKPINDADLYFPEDDIQPEASFVQNIGYVGSQTIYPRQWEKDTTTIATEIEDEDGTEIIITQSPLIARLLEGRKQRKRL